MAVAEQTTRLPMPARPSRWEKLRAGIAVLTRSKIALVGLALVGFWGIVALFADSCLVSPACWAGGSEYKATPLLARYSPFEQFRGASLQGPSSAHWLGTDRLGRDLWARLAQGARIILLLAPISVGMALLIGGIVVVETLFGYPGLGRYILEAALFKDIFAIEAAAMILVVIAVGRSRSPARPASRAWCAA